MRDRASREAGTGAAQASGRLSRAVVSRLNSILVERAPGFGPAPAARLPGGFDSADGYLRLWRTCFVYGSLAGALVGLTDSLAILAGPVTGSDPLDGVVWDARSASVLSGVMILLAAAAVLCLNPEPVSPRRRRIADLLAGLLIAISLISMAGRIAPGLSAGTGTELFTAPSIVSSVTCLLLGAGLLATDRGAPGYRFHNRITPVIALVLLIGLLTHGSGLPDWGSLTPALSVPGLVGLVAVVFAYMVLRPRRGIAGFMTAVGPGPAMARILAPVVLAIPVAMTLGRELSRGDHPGAVQWIDDIVVMVALITVLAYTSRRLQAYFEEWRRATDELDEQAGVLAAMAEGVAVMRIEDSRLVLTNPQFDRMHGYEPGALIDRSIETIMPDDPSPEEHARQEEIGRELAAEGRSNFESRAVCRDGSIIWCRTNSILTEDPRHGAVLVMVKSDITAERDAKLAGAVAEARFRQVFEQSPIGLCLVRPDGSFERVNRNFEELTGYSAAELAEMSFSDITHPDDLDQDLTLTSRMFRGETGGFEMEKRYIRKDGAVVRVNLSAVMLHDRDRVPSIALSMVQDVTEHHELSRKLRHLADHDPLTGLFNRRRLEHELARAVAEPGGGAGRGLAVMMIDLDNFKFINDSYGHAIGDRLIVRTGEVLKHRLRQGDVLARQGGDEFVLLLRDLDREEALSLARGLVAEISANARVEGPGFLARATASIGVAATAVPESGGDPEQLIREADIAMYEVKDSGRNDARVYNPSVSSNISQGIDWHGRIRDALDRDGFRLYCQPLVSLKGDDTPQFELFLRLPGRKGRMIGPTAFLPVAERHNLIGEIDSWVVRRAIRLLGTCRPERLPRLFVNLSGQSFGDMELLGLIEAELDRAGVDPGHLVFEVTETSAIANIDRAQTFTRELTRIGCHTALDDFGAGFASFYYLKHISTDYVKIDGEFIRNLAGDPTSQLLVRALTELCLGLGKRVVAEQVEDRRALDLLELYGVDLVQGYLFGRPVPAAPRNLTATASEPHRIPL